MKRNTFARFFAVLVFLDRFEPDARHALSKHELRKTIPRNLFFALPGFRYSADRLG